MRLLLSIELFAQALVSLTFGRPSLNRVYEVDEPGQAGLFDDVCFEEGLDQVAGVDVDFGRRAEMFEDYNLGLVLGVVHSLLL